MIPQTAHHIDIKIFFVRLNPVKRILRQAAGQIYKILIAGDTVGGGADINAGVKDTFDGN